MSKEIIISKYAQALASYARQKGLLDEVLKDYQETKVFLWDSLDARAYLLFPGVDKEEKLDLMSKCKEHLDLSQGFVRFLRLLLEKGRFNIFGEVYERFVGLYEVYNKKIHVKLTSAFPLSEREEDNIAQALKEILKRDLVIEKAVDHSLLGGLDIFLVNEDLKINLSLKSRLEKLKQQAL